MLLGVQVPVALKWTLPRKLVAASRVVLPAGRTLRRDAHGRVVLGLRVRLGARTVRRLRYVDQRSIGGKVVTKLGLGPYRTKTTYHTKSRPIHPDRDGSQTQITRLNISGMQVKAVNARVDRMPMGVATTLSTSLMIPGFAWSHCTLANRKVHRAMVTLHVRPATIATRVAGAQVTARVRDGAGARAVGRVRETIVAWSHHRKHRASVRGRLDKGTFVHSWRKALKRLGARSATVRVSFAGRTRVTHVHI